jgi:hypothetical protein
MWVTILQLLLLRLASHRHLGNSLHLRHHYNLYIHEASSQKGANDFREESEARIVNSTVPESKHIY